MLPTQATHPEEGGKGQSSPFPEGDRRVRQRRHPAAEQHEKRVAEMRNHAAAVRLEESLETKQRAPPWPPATDPQSHSPVVPEALVSAMVAEAHAAANATGATSNKLAQTVVGEFIVALGVAEPGTRVNELLNSMQQPEMRRLHQLLLSSRAALSRLDAAGGIAGWAAADRDLMDARLGEVVRLVDQRTKSLGKLRAAPEPTPREQMRRSQAALSLPALWESAAAEMEARTHLVAAGWLEGCAKSPTGCALVPYRMRGNDGHCDVCKAKQPVGTVMASCRAEDYDVCTKCIGQLSRDGSQRAMPPLHVVQAAPLYGFQAAAGQLPLGGSSLATQPLEEFWRGRAGQPVPPEMIGAMVVALEIEEEERQSLRRVLQQQQQHKAEAGAKFDALMARVPPEAPLLRARTQTQLDSLRSDMSQAEEQASRLRQRIEQLERQRCASSLAEPNLLDELVARLDLDLRSRAERDRPPRSPSFLDCPPAPRASDAAAPALIDHLPNEVLPALKGLVGVTFERNSHPSAGPGGALYERFLNQCADAAASALAGAGTSPDGASSAAIAAPFTVEEMEYTWCFGGFWDSSTYIDGKLYSPVFTSGLYNWSAPPVSPSTAHDTPLVRPSPCRRRLLLFPGGNKTPHLAAYLDVPDSATLPMGWTRDAHFTLTIHNQKETSRNVVKGAPAAFVSRRSGASSDGLTAPPAPQTPTTSSACALAIGAFGSL